MQSMSLRPKLVSVLMLQAPQDNRAMLVADWASRSADVMATVLRVHHTEVRKGEFGLMAHVLVTAVLAVLSDAQANRPNLLTDPMFEAELNALCVGYLRPNAEEN